MTDVVRSRFLWTSRFWQATGLISFFCFRASETWQFVGRSVRDRTFFIPLNRCELEGKRRRKEEVREDDKKVWRTESAKKKQRRGRRDSDKVERGETREFGPLPFTVYPRFYSDVHACVKLHVTRVHACTGNPRVQVTRVCVGRLEPQILFVPANTAIRDSRLSFFLWSQRYFLFAFYH